MKKMTKEEMKKVMGGVEDGGGGGFWHVKCCPPGKPNDPRCSDCQILFGNNTPTCKEGVVTDC